MTASLPTLARWAACSEHREPRIRHGGNDFQLGRRGGCRRLRRWPVSARRWTKARRAGRVPRAHSTRYNPPPVWRRSSTASTEVTRRSAGEPPLHHRLGHARGALLPHRGGLFQPRRPRGRGAVQHREPINPPGLRAARRMAVMPPSDNPTTVRGTPRRSSSAATTSSARSSIE